MSLYNHLSNVLYLKYLVTCFLTLVSVFKSKNCGNVTGPGIITVAPIGAYGVYGEYGVYTTELGDIGNGDRYETKLGVVLKLYDIYVILIFYIL